MRLYGLRHRHSPPAQGERERKVKGEEDKSHLEQAGQIVAIFALMLICLIGLIGLAIDVTFAWREELRIQRAADAAALAGVVYLPGDVPGGVDAAIKEAGKNQVSGGVSASQNSLNPRQMDVTVSAPVPTFFLRALGWTHFDITRVAHAVYILPVPMGSPDPYYGVFGKYKLKNGTTVTQSGPGGESIAARGLWGSMLSQGAATQNGDAYLPTKNIPGGSGLSTGTSPQHSSNYYDYAIEMPPGSTGTIYIFDPGFCAGDQGGVYGTGDKWFPSSSSNWNAVSAFYYLYNTNNQPYNPAAHTLIAGSGDLFANQKASDPGVGGPAVGGSMLSCAPGAVTDPGDGRYWHLKWWGMATVTGGATGTTYRLRTTSNGGTNQQLADACNQYSIYVETSGGAAKVYGIGAMQMYTPLLSGQSSVFYLAQIDAQAGAGKTIEIKLWDPGDTGQLSATLRILQPTATGWSAVPNLNWTARRVTSQGSNCVGGSGSGIVTNTGGNSLYNGCWLTIDIPVPTTYSAPQDGWWKIEYIMGGGSGNSTDETTWEVDIRGNPVHLIP